MELTIKLKGNIYNFMRAFGYHPEGRDEKTGQMIFARRLGPADYPRFHAYVKIDEGRMVINLHLDQKRPIYKTAPAHSAEYGGGVVEKEVKRILNSIPRSIS